MARVSFALTLSLCSVGGVGLLALFGVGAVAGGLGGFRGFMSSIGLSGTWLNPLTFMIFYSVVSLVAATIASLGGAVVALLFNALTPIVGGVEVEEN